MNFFFRQLWHDPRLAFNLDDVGEDSIRLSHSASVWRPDTFFRNNRYVRAKNVPNPEMLLSINATGHVWYVQRSVSQTSLSSYLGQEIDVMTLESLNSDCSLNGEFTCPTLHEQPEGGLVHCTVYVESCG